MLIVKIQRWSDVIDEWVVLSEAAGKDKELLTDYAIGWIDADIEQHGQLFSKTDYYYEVRHVTLVS